MSTFGQNRELLLLEEHMQQMLTPFLKNPLFLHIKREGPHSWSPVDHLEYIFHVNLQLLMNLHTLPAQEKELSRRPTLLARFILITGFFPQIVDRSLAPYEPGQTDRNRNINWLHEHYDFWNDKLAGLHFLPSGWQHKVLDRRHEKLGYLTGTDWIRIMDLFTRNHQKSVNKILQNTDTSALEKRVS